MDPTDQEETVRQFNECINNRDLDGLAALLTDDHNFIGAANETVQGKPKVLKAWEGFFNHFPDYQNFFETLTTQDNQIVIQGRSTCKDKRLDGPALWTAKVANGKVAEWRVYGDTLQNRKLLRLDTE